MNKVKSFIFFLFFVILIGIISVSANEDIRNNIVDTFQPKGSLKVIAEPADEQVEVYIDSEEKGKTPLEIKRIDVGKHTIKIIKEGFKEQFKEVNIEAKKTLSIVINLSEDKAFEEQGEDIEILMEENKQNTPTVEPIPIEKSTFQTYISPCSFLPECYSIDYPSNLSVKEERAHGSADLNTSFLDSNMNILFNITFMGAVNYQYYGKKEEVLKVISINNKEFIEIPGCKSNPCESISYVYHYDKDNIYSFSIKSGDENRKLLESMLESFKDTSKITLLKKHANQIVLTLKNIFDGKTDFSNLENLEDNDKIKIFNTSFDFYDEQLFNIYKEKTEEEQYWTDYPLSLIGVEVIEYYKGANFFEYYEGMKEKRDLDKEVSNYNLLLENKKIDSLKTGLNLVSKDDNFEEKDYRPSLITIGNRKYGNWWGGFMCYANHIYIYDKKTNQIIYMVLNFIDGMKIDKKLMEKYIQELKDILSFIR